MTESAPEEQNVEQSWHNIEGWVLNFVLISCLPRNVRDIYERGMSISWPSECRRKFGLQYCWSERHDNIANGVGRIASIFVFSKPDYWDRASLIIADCRDWLHACDGIDDTDIETTINITFGQVNGMSISLLIWI